MKCNPARNIWLAAAIVIFAGVLAACTLPPSASPVRLPSLAGTESLTLYVGPKLADCVGVAPQKCLMVKEKPEGEYGFWYDPIKGFDYQEGYEYQIAISRQKVENPPADRSLYEYTLTELISKTAVEEIAAAEEKAVALEGTLWVLATYTNGKGETVAVLPKTEITAAFQAGQVGGNATCNNYLAPYLLDGNKLTVGVVATTTMMCGPESASGQEADYLAGLANAASYQIVDGQLHIANGDGALVLAYSPAKPTALRGTTWELSMYYDGKSALVSPVAGSKITASFGEDGNVTGTGGCNDYQAPYEVTGDALQVGPASLTRKTCPEPAGVMEQETTYLAALESATTYGIQSDELTLTDAGGQRIAVYYAQAGAGQLNPSAMLANMEFKSSLTTSGVATLVDGQYTEASADGSASSISVMLTDYVATGELSAKEAAAAILVTTTGGSGTFYELAAVLLNDGTPTNVASILLGDRQSINSLEIKDNQIVVDMVTQGPEDPMCCPTQRVIQKYELQADQLVQISSEVVPSVVGVAWQWLKTTYADGTSAAPSDSTKYTAEFLTDGQLLVRADCNSLGGTYNVSGESLKVQVVTDTLSSCEEGSSSAQFVKELNAAASYAAGDNGLTINLAPDASMEFVAEEAATAFGQATAQRAPAAQPTTAPEPQVTAQAQPTTQAQPQPQSAPGLTGPTWEWVGFQSPTERFRILKPSAYTVQFVADGSVAVVADCNSGNGTYTAGAGGALSVEVTATSGATCGSSSRSDTFFNSLNAAGRYFMQGDSLFIDLESDGGTMKFGLGQ